MALKKSQKSLKKWTRQNWGYVSKGDAKKPRRKRGRYLPASVRKGMTASQKERQVQSTAKKQQQE